jgi:hypothetical protein
MLRGGAYIRGDEVVVHALMSADGASVDIPDRVYPIVMDSDHIATVALDVEMRARLRREREAARQDERCWCAECDLREVAADGNVCGHCAALGERHG